MHCNSQVTITHETQQRDAQHFPSGQEGRLGGRGRRRQCLPVGPARRRGDARHLPAGQEVGQAGGLEERAVGQRHAQHLQVGQEAGRKYARHLPAGQEIIRML